MVAIAVSPAVYQSSIEQDRERLAIIRRREPRARLGSRREVIPGPRRGEVAADLQPVDFMEVIKPPEGVKPWWEGMSLDAQEGLLTRNDPQEEPDARMEGLMFTPAQWNAHKERIRQKREGKPSPAVIALRRQCYCERCLKYNVPVWPAPHVPRLLNYSCYLERQQENREEARKRDPEFVAQLELLENGGWARYGSVAIRVLPNEGMRH